VVLVPLEAALERNCAGLSRQARGWEGMTFVPLPGYGLPGYLSRPLPIVRI
jgi:hypothetical protein